MSIYDGGLLVQLHACYHGGCSFPALYGFDGTPSVCWEHADPGMEVVLCAPPMLSMVPQHDATEGMHPALLAALVAELRRARAKHPGRRHRLAALVEEVGELAQALAEAQGSDRVREEALHSAVVALRIAEDGDADYDEEVAP